MAKMTFITFLLVIGLFTFGTMARYRLTVIAVRVKMEELMLYVAPKIQNLHKNVPNPPGNHKFPRKRPFTSSATTVIAYSMSLAAMLITKMENGPRPVASSLRAT